MCLFSLAKYNRSSWSILIGSRSFSAISILRMITFVSSNNVILAMMLDNLIQPIQTVNSYNRIYFWASTNSGAVQTIRIICNLYLLACFNILTFQHMVQMLFTNHCLNMMVGIVRCWPVLPDANSQLTALIQSCNKNWTKTIWNGKCEFSSICFFCLSITCSNEEWSMNT